MGQKEREELVEEISFKQGRSKNKQPWTEQGLKRLAVFYCSKRETSRKGLGDYLKRKCYERKMDRSMYLPWIKSILDDFEKTNVVNDARYADGVMKTYLRRGKGSNYIHSKLKEKGIQDPLRKTLDVTENELERAKTLVRKIQTRIREKIIRQMAKSPKSGANEKWLLRQKLLQKLVASGYSMQVSLNAISDLE